LKGIEAAIQEFEANLPLGTVIISLVMLLSFTLGVMAEEQAKPTPKPLSPAQQAGLDILRKCKEIYGNGEWEKIIDKIISCGEEKCHAKFTSKEAQDECTKEVVLQAVEGG
jgi:hypothetical protein